MQIDVGEPGEATVLLVLTANKMERAVILYPEDDPHGLEQGTDILARVAVQLAVLDQALRS